MELARFVLDAVPAAVIATDLEGRVISWNRAAEELFGWTAVEMIGIEIPVVVADGDGARDRLVARALRDGSAEATTKRQHKDGHDIDVSIRLGVVRNAKGVHDAWAVLCRDTSSQLQTASRLDKSQAELVLVRRLASLVQRILQDLDLSSVLQAIVQAGVDLLDVDSGVVSLEVRPGEFERMANVNIPGDLAGHEIVPGEGLHGRVLETGEPIVIENYDNWTGAVSAFKDRGYHASIAVPILRDDRVIGGLSLHSANPDRRFEPEEVDILALLADYAAVAIGNAETYRTVLSERERFLALVGAMPDGLAVVEAGLVTAWNVAAARLTGHESSDVLDRPPPLDLDAASVGVEVPVPGGRTRWIETVCSDLPDAGGQVYLLRDMTEQRDLERAKDLFFATTSHELKTPLTVVKGLASTLHQHWERMTPDDRMEALETIERRAASLDRLIERILVGSRVQAGAFHVTQTPVDLRPVIDDMVKGFCAAVGPEHVLRTELPDALPLVSGDRQALDTVLGHLLENAIKYSPDGGEVVITARRADDRLVVDVLDDGIGIEVDIDPLLSPFVQGDGQTARRFGGVGLGLYIVRELVEAQGGHISAARRAEGGSCFSFTIPLWS